MNNRIRSSNVQIGDSLILGESKNFASQEQDDDYKLALEEMLVKASEEAKLIVQNAEKKAVELSQKAAEDAEILKQQSAQKGYEEGFQKGLEEGIAQSRKECSDKVWGLDALTSSAFQVKKEIINSAEKEILELSIAIAEKILRNQLELKPELMQKIIQAAIEQLKDKEEINIIVNPALTQNLYEFMEDLKKSIRGLKTIKILEDKTIPNDGVIVESVDSRIDGRIETQLKEIARKIMLEFAEKSNSKEIPEEIEAKISKAVKNTESEKQ